MKSQKYFIPPLLIFMSVLKVGASTEIIKFTIGEEFIVVNNRVSREDAFTLCQNQFQAELGYLEEYEHFDFFSKALRDANWNKAEDWLWTSADGFPYQDGGIDRYDWYWMQSPTTKGLYISDDILNLVKEMPKHFDEVKICMGFGFINQSYWPIVVNCDDEQQPFFCVRKLVEVGN